MNCEYYKTNNTNFNDEIKFYHPPKNRLVEAIKLIAGAFFISVVIGTILAALIISVITL